MATLKRYNGTAFTEVAQSEFKYFNGSAFVEGSGLKYYNGTDWENLFTASGNSITGHPTLAVDLMVYYSWNTVDMSSGSPIDLTGNGYDGVGSPPSSVAGVLSEASYFDGINDFTSVTSSPFPLNSSFTIACWVKRHDLTAYTPVYGAATNFHEDGQIRLSIRSESYSNPNIIHTSIWRGNESGAATALSVTPISDTNWHFIVFRGDGVTETLNIDGGPNESTVTNYGYFLSGNTVPLTFGKERTAFGNVSIDESGIWNRYLTDQEVTDLHNSGLGLPYN